jgi:ABC-type multidrug transport system ATPase subunit
VREALAFSNALRVADASAAERRETVARVLRVLELEALADRLISSLARGERKRLTIGVELASNPSLVWLDEPTTALDSRSAALVMKALRRVARAGRAVVVSLHQPSADIFFSFSSLLLLAPGGYLVYFGPVGHRGTTVQR